MPRRWVRGLLDSGAISDERDLRFAAFSMGELARDAFAGPVGFVHSPIPLAVAARQMGPGQRLPGAHGPAPLAASSRRCGVVAVTVDDLVMARARTAFGRPHPPVARCDVRDLIFVRAADTEVAASLADGSVASFCFTSRADAARFVSLF